MSVMVDLTLVNAMVFAGLSLLCATIFVGLRRESSIAWLAASLLCAAVEVGILTVSQGGFPDMIAIAILVPAAYLCAGQAVRLMMGARRQNWRVLGAVAGLVALSILLLLMGVPFIYQTMPFQLACAIAVGEIVVRIYRSGLRGPLDIGLMAALTAIAGIFFLRIPLFPLLFAADTPYLVVAESRPERILMLLSGLLTPPTVFMLLAKIIGGIIATYRTRSEYDGLTGLLNRRAFDDAAAASRAGGGAVIFCDIDHFKQVNDRYGHQFGDEVIRAFAGLIKGTGHISGRMGGEEFAVLLPNGKTAEAVELAEMIRLRFADAGLSGLKPGHRLSASFGIAEYGVGEDLKAAFMRADAALYRAKKTGRNRVVVFSESQEAPEEEAPRPQWLANARRLRRPGWDGPLPRKAAGL